MSAFWRGFSSVLNLWPKWRPPSIPVVTQRQLAQDGFIALWQAYCDKKSECEDLRDLLQAKQARIDELMLEYCPGEMTPEQVETWANSQRRCSPEEEAAIAKALGEG